MDSAIYLRDTLFDVINAIEMYERSGDPSSDLQRVITKLDYVQRMAVNLDMDDTIITPIGRAYRMLEQIDGKNSNPNRYSASLNKREQRGRPSYNISEEQLSFLLEKGFQVKDIGVILGVSTRTVERRMSSFGLTVSGTLNFYTLFPLFCLLTITCCLSKNLLHLVVVVDNQLFHV